MFGMGEIHQERNGQYVYGADIALRFTLEDQATASILFIKL